MEHNRHPWLDLEAAFYGLDNLFGTYKELISSISAGDHLKEAPDPLKQFWTIKALNSHVFLQSNSEKPVKQDVLRQAMYLAAKFLLSNNVKEVTTKAPEEVITNRELLQSLRHQM
ncbi:hypothetical protein ACA910_014511 [Epithemia clementina (nom. ined.)]